MIETHLLLVDLHPGLVVAAVVLLLLDLLLDPPQLAALLVHVLQHRLQLLPRRVALELRQHHFRPARTQLLAHTYTPEVGEKHVMNSLTVRPQPWRGSP